MVLKETQKNSMGLKYIEGITPKLSQKANDSPGPPTPE